MSGMLGRERKPTPLITALACHTRRPSGDTASISQTLASVVPDHRLHFGVELDVVPNPELVGDPVEVLLVLVLFAERIRVLEVGAEDVRVGATRGVDTRSRVAVLEPGSADSAVLLEHDEGHAGALQLDGGAQPAGTGADHHHGELLQPLRRRLLPPDEPSRPWVDGQLLEPHLQVGCGDLLPAGKGEAPWQSVRRPDGDVLGTAVPIGLQEVCRLGLEQRGVRAVGQHHRLDEAEHPGFHLGWQSRSRRP